MSCTNNTLEIPQKLEWFKIMGKSVISEPTWTKCENSIIFFPKINCSRLQEWTNAHNNHQHSKHQTFDSKFPTFNSSAFSLFRVENKLSLSAIVYNFWPFTVSRIISFDCQARFRPSRYKNRTQPYVNASLCFRFQSCIPNLLHTHRPNLQSQFTVETSFNQNNELSQLPTKNTTSKNLMNHSLFVFICIIIEAPIIDLAIWLKLIIIFDSQSIF